MESYYNNKELKYLNKNYSFNNALSTPLILNQIFQFLDKEKVKSLSLCNKKIYQIYFSQVKNVQIKKKDDIAYELIDKYKNVTNLDLEECEKIKDFTLYLK